MSVYDEAFDDDDGNPVGKAMRQAYEGTLDADPETLAMLRRAYQFSIRHRTQDLYRKHVFLLRSLA